MSRYLSHLAALTLNQVEPVQPRLASRFEMPVDRSSFGNNGLDVAQEFRVVPSAHLQSSTVTATDSPVVQKVVAASADLQGEKEASGQDQARVFERTEFMIKKSESPSDQQRPSSGQSFTTMDTEQTKHADHSVNKPVVQAHYHARKDILSTKSIHAPVEHFTETTHNELFIRAAAPDANRKISKLEETLRPAPVKPASIVVRSEQSTVGPVTPSQADAQSGLSAHSGTDIPPPPTIQVTIGRIEIRATQIADKPAAKPHTASNTMSLDEYLNRRNGGRS